MDFSISNLSVKSFFALFLILGITLVPDYGISWDEAVQRRHGIVTFDYVNEKLNLGYQKYRPKHELKTYRERHYGVLFSTSCFVLEKTFGLTENFRGRYLMRHYLNFFLFWLGSIFFFKILKHHFENWKFALLGTLFLILSPRIFANSFYNSKDLILLPCFIIAAYTMIRFLDEKNGKYALLHALACGVVVNTRIVGILIPVLTVFWWLLDWINTKVSDTSEVSDTFNLSSLKNLLVYIFGTIVLTVLFRPWLWENPIAHFAESWQAMSKFNWGGKNLYWGEFIPGDEMPWHYIPSWILITTPIFYLFLFLTGVFFISKNLINSLKINTLYKNSKQRNDLIFASLFLAPILAIIVKESTVYNGWRQLYFVYPFLLAIGITGLLEISKIWQKHKSRILIVSLIFSFQIAFWMFKNHPHQNVYFNAFAGKNKFEKFDLEYWGLSYKQAFEKLAELYPNDTLSVKTGNYPGEENHRFLPKKIKGKINLTYGKQTAGFFISNLYGEKENLKFKAGNQPYKKEVFAIKVDDEPIIRIFQLP